MSAPPRDRPTRAVALKYDQTENRAPHVAATGSGSIAERILEAAREHGVPIRQDPDLAEALAQLDLAQTIPVELYAVIAEVFAWAYKANSGYPR
ncbi:MAG: EscU/YscU/HrcU family type III secretion system export apparatus switch protein [Thermoleophilia bacterium]|nr:EscU/YscU/HrcU family type III secretion system export apparatus switch protein [Thermoleophilia bacterium]